MARLIKAIFNDGPSPNRVGDFWSFDAFLKMKVIHSPGAVDNFLTSDSFLIMVFFAREIRSNIFDASKIRNTAKIRVF
jgi:hypothetical protein